MTITLEKLPYRAAMAALEVVARSDSVEVSTATVLDECRVNRRAARWLLDHRYVKEYAEGRRLRVTGRGRARWLSEQASLEAKRRAGIDPHGWASDRLSEAERRGDDR